jgi:hypothetical protein
MGRVDLYLHSLVNVAVDGGELSASRRGLFALEESPFPPSFHCITVCMGPRAGLDDWKRETSFAAAVIESRFVGCPAHDRVTILCELSRLPLGVVESFILDMFFFYNINGREGFLDYYRKNYIEVR